MPDGAAILAAIYDLGGNGDRRLGPISYSAATKSASTVNEGHFFLTKDKSTSFAIAGLLQKTSMDQTNALPGIGEVPVLGALFKSNDFQRGESELVIIVTPYIVKPASSPSAFL